MPRQSSGRSTCRRNLQTGAKPAQHRQVVLHIALEYIEPPIWRRVRVPENYTLHQLHRVLQFVFSWLDYHLYRLFRFRADPRLYGLKGALSDTCLLDPVQYSARVK